MDEVRNPRPRWSKNAINCHTRRTHRDARDKRDSPRGQTSHNCTRCVQTRHKPGDRCPAKEAICRKCNKKGHYAAVCFSKTQKASAHEVEAEDPAFLGVLQGTNDSSWTSTLRIAGKRIHFKLDTGAEVTAISETTYYRWTKSPYREHPDPCEDRHARP